LIQCTPVTHSLYSSSCSHLAGYLSPLPCTKVAVLDGSKHNHLYPSGWFHCILRIAFIICIDKCVQWDGVPLAKSGKMAWDEPPRLGTERYPKIQNLRWSAKVQVHPKTIGKLPLAWHFDVSIEDALSRMEGEVNTGACSWIHTFHQLSCFLPTIACSNAMHAVMQLIIHNKLDYMYDQYSILSGEDGPRTDLFTLDELLQGIDWAMPQGCSNIPCGWIHLVVATLWLEQWTTEGIHLRRGISYFILFY
jgi:hypothetical protein